MSELIDPEEAFAEGDRQRAAKMEARFPRMARIMLVGGPLHEKVVVVPLDIVQRSDGMELPLALPRMSETIIIPGERRRHGVYRLDRAQGVARYTETVQYQGAP